MLGSRCFAWALMSNHVHLVVRTDKGCLSSLIQRLHTSFAIQFNLSRGRQGHVFQSRFHSRLVRDDADLMVLIRYVHRNPLEAGLVTGVRGLARYAWCGHAALIGHREPYAFEAVDEALSLFGGESREAIREYGEWMAQLPGGERTERVDELNALIRETCAELGVSEADLRDGSRRHPLSEVRARICQKAVGELGLRGRDVARRLGLTEGAVSQALRRVTKVPRQTRF
jgi:hypothetical protein